MHTPQSVDPSGSSHEIERLRAALAQTEERFRSFIDSEVETIFCYEVEAPISMSLEPSAIAERFLEARLVMCNRLYARARGASRPEELYGRGMRELAQESIGRIRQLIELLLVMGNRHDGIEVKQTLPDGSTRYFLSKGHLVTAEGHAIRLWVMLRDITEQKRLRIEREALEMQLRQAQRMESLGLLAGGIAHDFNNLLVVIENCAKFAESDLERDPAEARESLRQIGAASTRAAELIRSLLAFTRRTSGSQTAQHIDALVDDVMGLLRRLIPSRITFNTKFGAPNLVAEVDRGQVEQMLVNLVINAVDAMNDVGEIRLHTEEVDLLPLQRAAYPWVAACKHIRISVTDTGPGIPAEVRSRVFEPFFTTKADGKGTGLGLAVVWGTAKQHGGFVEVQESPPHGACFSIYLPCCQASAKPLPELVAPVQPPGGNETIFLVEDHELVRDVAKAVLKRAGYRVIVACDGAEALTTFARHKDEIDAVVLDAVVPVVNGFVVFQNIQRACPGMPIIVASGHSNEVFPAEFFFEQKTILLPKPYRGDDLLVKLRQAFAEARPRP